MSIFVSTEVHCSVDSSGRGLPSTLKELADPAVGEGPRGRRQAPASFFHRQKEERFVKFFCRFTGIRGSERAAWADGILPF